MLVLSVELLTNSVRSTAGGGFPQLVVANAVGVRTISVVVSVGGGGVPLGLRISRVLIGHVVGSNVVQPMACGGTTSLTLILSDNRACF